MRSTRPRSRLALRAGLLSLVGALTSLGLTVEPAAAAPSCATSSPTGAYTVKVCITAPATGATVSGDVPVTASVTVTGTSPGVAKTYWTINGGLLLTDYANPYGFTLYTDDFADGSYSVSVVANLRDGNTSAPASITLTFANGNLTTPTNSASWQPPRPAQHPWGTPMRVAAAGDGAGGEANASNVINTIDGWSPDLFFYLGDVYEDGTLTEFRNWYGTSGTWWDRFRSITLPVIGNHEYDGGGYFDYWDNIPHYYSFDANGWHVIAIDTTSQYNQTAPTSAQYQWFAADLAANTSPCTIVIGHHPLYNVGKEDPATRLTGMWGLMAQYGVTMFLVGHDHTYQRWHPLDGNGARNDNGVVEVVSGGGGHSSQSPITSDPRVAVKLKSYGASRFDLYGDHLDFAFLDSLGTTLDQGSLPCKGHDGIAPTPPTGVTGTAAQGDVYLSWSPASDNFGVTSYAVLRNGVLIATTSDPSYVDTAAPPNSTVSYRVIARDAAGNQTQSGQIQVNTGGSDANPPTVPTGLQATLRPDSSVDLTWAESTDDVGVDHYTVYRDGSPIATTATTSHTDQLPPGADGATYRVSAADAAGNTSGLSAPASVSVTDTVPPGTPPSLTVATPTPNSARLDWGPASDNVGVTGYRVAMDGNEIGTTSASVRTLTYSQVLSESTHTFTVRAEDARGNLSDPATVSVTQPVADGLSPAADSWVNSASPAATAGTSTLMRADVDPLQRPYVRFDLGSVQGQVVRARLRIYANTKSTTPVAVRTSATGWAESTLSWSTAPAPGATVATIPAWAAGGWITVDVTSAVAAGQPVSFVLDTPNTTSTTFAARESGTAPQLLVDVFS